MFDSTVDAFLQEHPKKADLQALRLFLLGLDPQIQEGIKWNSLSFRTSVYFATANLHPKEGIRLILHTGAKGKADTRVAELSDSSGLLKWLARDRAMVTIRDATDLLSKQEALTPLLREWIRLL